MINNIKQNPCIVFMLMLMGFAVEAMSQGYSYYEDPQFDPYQRLCYRVGDKQIHSSLRVYKLDDFRSICNVDSAVYADLSMPDPNVKSNIFRRFFNDDFLRWRKDGIYVAINPLFDFELGKDSEDGRKTYINTRGFYLNGNLGRNFWFYMDFTENQAKFPAYYMYNARAYTGVNVVPGEAMNNKMPESMSKYLISSDFDADYRVANGYIAFNIGKYLDFQLGKGKTFVGDGYRSLFLSDVASSYPFFKMNVTFWNVKYMFMLAQLRHHDGSTRRVKYSVTHYLDWNIGNRFTLGLFENVIQAGWNRKTDATRSLDWEYINPFIIFRPGEFETGSDDNAMGGFSMKFKAANWITFHGQFMLDDFGLDRTLHNKGHWGNKYGFLYGAKLHNMFRVNGFDMQMEYSQVRPYCYSHYDGASTYAHHGESLAHPLGANFKEGLLIVNYRHKRLMLRGQLNIAQYGADFANDTISYGHNINTPNDYRASDDGMYTCQGLKTNVRFADVSATCLINPKTAFNFTTGFRYRKQTSDELELVSKHIYVALRWSLKHHYYDY
ncbi:MAG: hypothetical protein J6Y72_03460 [Bacteroidales bacterium]|nr:hypothetical protein [Bacteroidales bacterium]